MVLKYFFARLKRNIGLTIIGSLAIFVVCVMLIAATAMPQVIGDALQVYNKQLCGDTDIMLTNSPETKDRFFGLTALKDDSFLKENSEYINGFFMAFADVGHNDTTEACTVVAAKYNQQQQYNPINGENLPNEITDSDIIIGAEYAHRSGINIGDEINLIFMEKKNSFRVVGIAENEGLFFMGNSVFISSYALKRFISFFGSDLVTHGFIKIKSTSSLELVQNYLGKEFDYLRAVKADKITDLIFRQVIISLTLITAIVVVFCILALTIILKIIFSRERDNFTLLKALGMPDRNITAIGVLTSLLMCVLAFIFAVPAILLIGQLLRSSSFLYGNISTGVLPFLIGIAVSIGISLICTIISVHEKEEPKRRKEDYVNTGVQKKGKDKNVKFNKLKKFSNLLIFAFFVIFAIVSIKIIPSTRYLGLIFAAISLISLIIFIPKAIGELGEGLFNINKSITVLRLKNLTQKRDWHRFLIFVTLGIMVITLLLLLAADMRSNIANAMINQVDITSGGETLGKVQLVSSELASYFFSDFIWLVDVFCWCLICLTAITTVFMIIMRRISFQKETRSLIPLGLTKSADVWQNAFIISVGLVPTIISVPFIILSISLMSEPFFALFNSAASVVFNLPIVLVASAAGFVFIVIVEILICIKFWKSSVKKVQS